MSGRTPPCVKSVYDRQYTSGRYSHAARAACEDHGRQKEVCDFVERYGLSEARCLEVGCGRGPFQDLVDDYVGLDISSVAGDSLHKPFVAASATQLPFADRTFDAVWSVNSLEHIPNPGGAMREVRRVLKHKGLLLLAPAWYCRRWAAKGYAVRPYSDFGCAGKIAKASVPVRNSPIYRFPGVAIRRGARAVHWIVSRRPTDFRYTRLEPNYEHIWTSDADAVNSMDPFEAILWFVSRGDICLTYPGRISALRVNTGSIVFQVLKD